MTGRMLVAYGTKHGSTIEVAEAIAAALRDSGHEVDVGPAADVRALDDYGAVVSAARSIWGAITRTPFAFSSDIAAP